jgi:hypothetical protein
MKSGDNPTGFIADPQSPCSWIRAYGHGSLHDFTKEVPNMNIRKEDVLGVNVQDKIFCIDCVSDADLDDAEAGDFILDAEDDENFIFCDVCKKRIL